MDTNALLVFGGTVAASVVAAILAGRWSRADKHSSDLVELKGQVESVGREKALELRAVDHRLKALERETRLSRKRYHKLRELLVRVAGAVRYKLRREDLEEDDDEDEDGD